MKPKKRIPDSETPISRPDRIGRRMYQAAVVVTIMAMCSIHAFAAGETVWTKAQQIMNDVYGQIVTISTIAAVMTASVALLLMNFSKNGRTVDESRAWLGRICITWAIINGLGFILAWNYIKLLFEAAERYILLGVLVFTAPVAFALGGSQSTSNIFKSWCRMLGGQIFLLVMNAWCLKLFTNMFGEFIANPLGTGDGGNLFIWFLCAIAFLKVSQKIDSFMAGLGISVGHTGGNMPGEALIAAKSLGGFKKGGTGGGIPAAAAEESGSSGYGKHLAISHGGGYVTLYAHCSQILMREGEQVTAGQTIAKVGKTGWATGPHLHIEVIIDGTPVDPLGYLSR